MEVVKPPIGATVRRFWIVSLLVVVFLGAITLGRPQAAFAYAQATVGPLSSPTCDDVAEVSRTTVQWQGSSVTTAYVTIMPNRGGALFEAALIKAPSSGSCVTSHRWLGEWITGYQTLNPNTAGPDCAIFPDLPQNNCWRYLEVTDTTVTPNVAFQWPIWSAYFNYAFAGAHTDTSLDWSYYTNSSTNYGTTGAAPDIPVTGAIWDGTGTDANSCYGCTITALPSGYIFTPGEPEYVPPDGGPDNPFNVEFPNADSTGSGCTIFDLGCWFTFLFVPDEAALILIATDSMDAAEGRFPIGTILNAIEGAAIIRTAYSAEMQTVCGGFQHLPGFSATTPGGFIQIFMPDPCDTANVAAQLWGYRAAIRGFLVIGLYLGFGIGVIRAWWPTGLEPGSPEGGSDE